MRYTLKTERETYTISESERLRDRFGFQFYRSSIGDPNLRYITPNRHNFDGRYPVIELTGELLSEIVREFGDVLVTEDSVIIQNQDY